MTEEQIIKELECRIDNFSKSVLDLINRQKAEIERCKKENSENFDKWKMLADKTEKHYSTLYEEAKENLKSEARKEFAEKAKPIIQEMVDVMFDDNISRCFVNNCKKPTSLPCESKICIEENKAFWTTKIDNLLKEMEGAK